MLRYDIDPRAGPTPTVSTGPVSKEPMSHAPLEARVEDLLRRSMTEPNEVLAEIAGLETEVAADQRPALALRLSWARARALNRTGALREALAHATAAVQLA